MPMHSFYNLLSSFRIHKFYFNFSPYKVLEKYQVYGDSILWRDGRKPNVRDVVKVSNECFHDITAHTVFHLVLSNIIFETILLLCNS